MPKIIKNENPLAVQQMFNSIAPRYDLLNRLMTFGVDIIWRKKAINRIREKRGGRFLDLAAGSGDFTLEAVSIEPEMIIASDFAINMHEIFKRKISRAKKKCAIHYVVCDALYLPFLPGSFDVVMVAFGIRNFADRTYALTQIRRVLKPDGIVLILELTYPNTPVIRQLYSLYTKLFIPILGRIISRHDAAYSYLPKSIEAFPSNEIFAKIMTEVGFNEVNFQKLTFGTATIFTGRKPLNPK